MPSILDILKSAGNGLGTGLGVALTPLAMTQAAASGRNPFSILEQARNGGIQQQLQQQQLANAQQQGLIQRAGALQDPATRALLGSSPELAGSFGIPSVPGGIASPEVLAGAGGGPAPFGGQVPMLPPEVDTTQSIAREAAQSRQGYYALLQQLLQQQMGGGAVPAGGALPPTPGQPSAAPTPGAPGASPPLRLTGLGAGGPTFSSEPTKTAQKQGQELSNQRIRSAGAFGMLDDLEASVNRIYTAQKATELPGQAARLAWAAFNGDPDAVNIQTAIGRLPVIVEALQRDGRISNQDASFLLGNLPNLYLDLKPRALSKLAAVRRTLQARNINLDAELGALNSSMGGGRTPPIPRAPTGEAPAGPLATPEAAATPPAASTKGIEAARERVRALGAQPQVLQRATGGPIPPGATAMVGEYGPELVSQPSGSAAAAQVTPMAPPPMQLAQAQPTTAQMLNPTNMAGARRLMQDPKAFDEALENGLGTTKRTLPVEAPDPSRPRRLTAPVR